MTARQLLKIEKLIALVLVLINLVLLALGIVTGVSIIGPAIGLVVMAVLYVILVIQEKKLNGK